MKPLIAFCVLALFVPTIALAQQQGSSASSGDTAALEQKIRDLEDRLIALEGQMRTLKAQGSQAPAAASAPVSAEAAPSAPVESIASTQVSLGGAGGPVAQALNPDISMIGDFVAVAGGNSIRPSPALEMHESELGVQAIIDPYARGDFFLTFGEQGVGLEEGYITFTALPGDFVARVGKMRSAFGKVNGMHNHVLPFVDRPLVTQNLVAGEDGIDDAGVSVERIIPFPKGIFLSATGQVFRGDSGADDEQIGRASCRE